MLPGRERNGKQVWEEGCGQTVSNKYFRKAKDNPFGKKPFADLQENTYES